jgi:hypothetical protein
VTIGSEQIFVGIGGFVTAVKQKELLIEMIREKNSILLLTVIDASVFAVLTLFEVVGITSTTSVFETHTFVRVHVIVKAVNVCRTRTRFSRKMAG